MPSKKTDLVRALLNSIQTGDPAGIQVVNEDVYIQHNPQTHEGSEGLAALFARLAKTNPRVNVVRAFTDGDYVFGHVEYDFSTRRIGFEVFRFEGDRIVEHWDNIQPRQGPNASGRSMVDGPTEATDLHLTEANRALVRSFYEDVLIGGNHDRLEVYLNADNYLQHGPHGRDGVQPVREALSTADLSFDRQHRVLAEGDFVLSVCEGTLEGVQTSFYDLFRVKAGKLVEHWDTVEAVPPRSEWKNSNGKF